MRNILTVIVCVLCILVYIQLISAAQWTEYRITPSPADQYNASINGNMVVWGAALGASPGGADINDIGEPIYFYIPDGRDFDIGGDIIVYRVIVDDELSIYMYNLSTSSEFLISSNGGPPSTDGETVVYIDTSGSVHGYDLFWQDNFQVPGSNSLSGLTPKVDGDIIIWIGSQDWEIFGFKISTWEKFLISEVSGPFDISGDLVVLGKNSDIYCFDISDPCTPVEFPICTDINSQSAPAISSNIIVWQDNRNGNWDIYGYNILTEAEFQITDDTADQTTPAISGNTVIWEDMRNGQRDIYAAILDGPLVPKCSSPLQGDLNGDCKVNFTDFALMLNNWLECNLDPPEACF